MSEETIWYRNGKQKVGPFSFSTIKELREKSAISDETLVTCDDGTTWTAYDKFLDSIENIKPKTAVEKIANIPPIILPGEPSISRRQDPIFSRNPDKSITSDVYASVSSLNTTKENAGTFKKIQTKETAAFDIDFINLSKSAGEVTEEVTSAFV